MLWTTVAASTPLKPFDPIRAAFYLLAVVILIVMLETLLVLLGCSWVVVVMGREPLGSCQGIGNQVREVITEMVAAVLALIVASRGAPPKE